jgi:predicted ATP-dependent endonuclease of OLD family
MIRKLIVEKCEFNLKVNKINFSKGLNIILGSNGSGKSSIMNFIKAKLRIFHKACCTSNKITLSEKLQLEPSTSIEGSLVSAKNDVGINADRFYLPRGIETGWDGEDGLYTVASIYDRGSISNGEHKMESLNILRKYIESRDWDIFKSKKLPILLFDEPNLGMQPEYEKIFFEIMEKWGEEYQIIIATNTPFCFGVRANFVELEKDYKDNKIKFVRNFINNLGE